MGRTIVIKRRVSLASYSDGWDDCYLVFTSMTKPERDELVERTRGDDLPDDQAETYLDEYLSSHFVSGKIRVTDDDGKETLSEAEADDMKSFPLDTKTSIFVDITTSGAQFRNPKA